jgi:hypothetical protein
LCTHLQVVYGSKQTFISKLRKLDARGNVRMDQDFVFAATRPLAERPLTISVYTTKDKT